MTIPEPQQIDAPPTLAAVPDDGLWREFIEVRFLELGTGRRFKLSAETDHGAGGAWTSE